MLTISEARRSIPQPRPAIATEVQYWSQTSKEEVQIIASGSTAISELFSNTFARADASASVDERALLKLIDLWRKQRERLKDSIEFNELYKQWQKTRNTLSSIVSDITRNEAYFQIVGMGPRALPFIFAHLRQETKNEEPDHWFPALTAITKTNPVPPEDAGKINRMAEVWLRWAKREGYFAKAMGK
jgi:hypothetical protein